MEDSLDPRILASVDASRRELLKKLLLGSAFVLPAVASFPMDALAQNQPSMRGINTTDPFLRANPGGVAKELNPAAPGGTGRASEPTKR